MESLSYVEIRKVTQRIINFYSFEESNFQRSIYSEICGRYIIVDPLSILSMGSTTHVKEWKKEMAKEVHILAWLGVNPVASYEGGVLVLIGNESSLEVEVKENKDKDPILLQLKENVHK